MNASLHVLLADDDSDDCLFFEQALNEMSLETTFTYVSNGAELMKVLSKTTSIPDVLFLDLNMPLKNGFECLEEIKKDERLKNIPVVIYSTSLDIEKADELYDNGAHYYIRKPGEYRQLKKVIMDALTIFSEKDRLRPEREKFVLDA